jgi:hypothetical protein
MAATQAFAAKRRLIGSISPAYEFVDNRSNKARAEQHRANHDVEQVFNARHALVAFGKSLLYRGIAFTAYRNVDGVIFFYLAHAAGVTTGAAAASASACASAAAAACAAAATAASWMACSSAVYSTIEVTPVSTFTTILCVMV